MKISELTELVYLLDSFGASITNVYGGIELNLTQVHEAQFYCNIKSNRSFIDSTQGSNVEQEIWTCTMRYDSTIFLSLKKLIIWRNVKHTITSIANVDEGKCQWVRFTITKLNV